MTLIVDRAGSGAALTADENDTNLDSLSGINVVDATTSLTIAATHQNDTVEFTNAGAVAVTLDLLATILAAIDTTDYKVKLLNTGAGTVTITPNGSNSINTGASTIVLLTDEFVILQNDNSNLIWNIIGNSTTLNNAITSTSPTITSPIINEILDTNGNEVLELSTTASAVNNLKIANGSTGGFPSLSAAGEADIGQIFNDSNGAQVLVLATVASAANYVQITSATTGNAATISVAETNTDLALSGNGTGVVTIDAAVTDSVTAETTNGDLTLAGNGTGKVLVDGIYTKILDIGDWNMDTGATVSVPHGETHTKIRSINVIIRDDTDTNYRTLTGGLGLVNTAGGVAVSPYADATNVVLARVTNGTFDSTDYDSTSYNRGWITIEYTD